MKLVNVNVARKVRIVSNNALRGPKWAKVIDVRTGVTLHTGSLPYIRKMAIGKYNMLPQF